MDDTLDTSKSIEEVLLAMLAATAFEGLRYSDNAADLPSRFVAEAANGPTTPAADRILFGRDIPVLPDILANAGGVTVSYNEWVQNNENEQWEESEVNEKLHKKMVRATDAVIDRQQEINESLDALEARRAENGRPGDPLEPVGLRTSAFVLAVERVAGVTLERGIWP